MLLSEMRATRLRRWCSGMTFYYQQKQLKTLHPYSIYSVICFCANSQGSNLQEQSRRQDQNNIKMGCVVDTPVDVHTFTNPIDTLKHLVLKLKVVCQIGKQRQTIELQKFQRLLLAQFSKPTKSRSKNLEQSMIQNNLVFYAKGQIFMMLENHSKILYEHKNFFEDQAKLINVKTSVDTMLYCSQCMDNEDLIKFNATFRNTYPSYTFPSDNEMDEFLRQFKVSRKVSPQIQLAYIWEFCNKYNIPAQTINQIGHNYKYGSTNQ